MGWIDQIDDVLQRYRGASASNPAPNAPADFARVAEQAPPSAISGGLAEAFRSPQTPPFGQMIADLFGMSNGQQRAGILNHLIAAAGPGAGGLLSQLAGGSAAGPSPGQTAQSRGAVTPEQVQQVQPAAVRELAEQAQKNDPTIVDRAGEFYAQHPKLVQGLGAAALALVMSHVSRRH